MLTAIVTIAAILTALGSFATGYWIACGWDDEDDGIDGEDLDGIDLE